MKFVFIFMIDLYRKFISPLFPSSCRFYPTCSTYARQVFIKFGFFRGLFLSVKRIIKCNPLHRGGIDKVPEEFNFFGGKKQ